VQAVTGHGAQALGERLNVATFLAQVDSGCSGAQAPLQSNQSEPFLVDPMARCLLQPLL